jgi:glutamyl-tRNA synthetase
MAHSSSTPVRVRFAPSPTGFFHIGSARTALFNWLYARHTGGTFILRVEDTDLARNSEEALEVLYKGMRWLGLDWDEGPGVEGPYAPYFQSQRGAIYDQYLEKLKATGRTYEQDGALYFRVSGKPQLIKDVIRGNVERTEEKDFVICRSDGRPVFHFVNVVDDIEMKITHVIRGEDHLSNTSKHQEIFEALGAPIPLFAHLPLILKTDGPGKMSKRDRGSLIEEYVERGFLPEAVLNFICLLGWSPKENREILPIDEIISLFELTAINKNNARFDEQKMTFMNAEYVRHLPIERLVENARPILNKAQLLGGVDEGYLKGVLQISQEKMRGLEEIPQTLRFFFTEDFAYDPAALAKVKAKPVAHDRLKALKSALEGVEPFDEGTLEAAVQSLAQSLGVGTGEFIPPARLATSGMAVGPSFYGMLRALGRERVLKRLDRALAELSA